MIATTAALIKLREAGFKPTRDIIVFFTGDEETEGNGARLGATEWRNLLDAEYALNADAGGGAFTRDGRPLGFGLQTAEKIFQILSLHRAQHAAGTAAGRGPTMRSMTCRPRSTRLSTHRFTPMLNETTRAYFTERAKQESGRARRMRCGAWLANPNDAAAADAIEANELETGITRTRCVATMLEGGHAQNALPQKARGDGQLPDHARGRSRRRSRPN